MEHILCVRETEVPSEPFFFLRLVYLSLRGESGDLQGSGAGTLAC